VAKVAVQSRRVLLLVDDEADLGALFTRLLARSFDEVHYAVAPGAAEELMSRVAVTHLVVDSSFDHGGTRGQDLVTAWRRRHPSIGYAAVFTGRRLDPQKVCAEVDEVFTKPDGLEALIARLRQR
jgi:DNA-binding response OmpR family regulator